MGYFLSKSAPNKYGNPIIYIPLPMSSQLSWNIIRHFSSRNMSGFTFQDVTRAFPEKNRVHLARILAEMVNMGMLCKISLGNYHIIPINEEYE